jgi:hypothetical protein
MRDKREILSNVRPSTILKTVIYSLFSVSLICTVSSFLPALGYAGAAPDLILCATVALAYYEGERASAVFGMISGYALESVGSTGFSILPLFYMLVGCVCAMLFLKILGKNIGAYLIYVAAFSLVRAAISLIYVQFTTPDFAMGSTFMRVVLPEYGVTLLASPVVFWLCGLIARGLNRNRGIQEGRLS